MTAIVITPRGRFSLAASMRFLEGFTPAAYRGASDGRVLRLAFPADDGHSTVSAEIGQAQGSEGAVQANVTVHTGNPDKDGMGATSTESDGASAVRAQLARVLSLDVDGSGFPRLAEDDPVVAELIAAYPGLRPVCFYSPYEAAAWAIIGHRIRMVQAAAIKARIAQHHGQCFTVAGESLYAFPTPLVLRGLSRVPGLPQTKVERLRVLADATLVGVPVEEALAHLRTLPILIRGSAHPDVFPRHERRLHASMAEAYGLGDPNDSDRASSPGSAITGRHTAVGSRSCCVPAVRRRPGREPAVARCGSARSGQVQRHRKRHGEAASGSTGCRGVRVTVSGDASRESMRISAAARCSCP